jgi:hypothetical protein
MLESALGPDAVTPDEEHCDRTMLELATSDLSARLEEKLAFSGSCNMDLLTIGEILVEFVRRGKDQPHLVTGEYAGPFPSGAPAIFADTAARLGLKSAIIGSVGEDDFGALLCHRLVNDGVYAEGLLTNGQYTTGIAFVTYYSNGERDFISPEAFGCGSNRVERC